jgi:hypothetical protein
MAFSRFHDDPARIKQQLEQDTFPGRYQLNTPGPGDNLPFWEDPNIRLQRWGANLKTNTTDFESELRGMTRKLNHDEIGLNDYKLKQTHHAHQIHLYTQYFYSFCTIICYSNFIIPLFKELFCYKLVHQVIFN